MPLFSRKDYTKSSPTPAQDDDGRNERTDAAAGRNIQILEAAIERGLGDAVSARNAYRTTTLPGHDTLAAIAGAFGARIRGFAVTRDSRQFGFFDGAYISGVRDSVDTIYLNESAQRPHLALLGHELVHRLKQANPKPYEKFVKAIKLHIDPEC